jgi:plasmid stabilization system protein ParE
VYSRILDRATQLVDHSESGAIVPEFNRGDIREVFVHLFRLIYRIEGNEIRMLTVIQGRRKLPETRFDNM